MSREILYSPGDFFEVPTGVKVAHIVAARYKDALIGVAGGLPWARDDKDMARFVKLTRGLNGVVVLMGRKTYESIPVPLRGRVVIVVGDSAKTFAAADAKGSCAGGEFLRVATSLSHASKIIAALAFTARTWAHTSIVGPKLKTVMIAGGETIYRATMTHIDTVYLTVMPETGTKCGPEPVYYPDARVMMGEGAPLKPGFYDLQVVRHV